MRIYFIRHGDPDYAHDCLTPLGHEQAEACAEIMKNIHVNQLFSSSCGRAYETGLHLASKIGLEIEQFDCFREICWGRTTFEPSYHPWNRCESLVRSGIDLTTYNWQEDPYYKDTTLETSYHTVTNGLDSLLLRLGFERNEYGYKCLEENGNTYFFYSHGGVQDCIFAYLLNQPLFYSFYMYHFAHTSISFFDFPARVGEVIVPRLGLFNDARHITQVNETFGR